MKILVPYASIYSPALVAHDLWGLQNQSHCFSLPALTRLLRVGCLSDTTSVAVVRRVTVITIDKARIEMDQPCGVLVILELRR